MATKWKWADRLAAAVKRGHFTVQDKGLAADWGTCAVGELPLSISGIKLGGFNEDSVLPKKFDLTLDEQGQAFSEFVDNDRVGDAVNAYFGVRNREREIRAERKKAA